MAILNFVGFETGLNQDETTGVAFEGVFTGISTSAKRSGAYGLKMDVSIGNYAAFYVGVPSTTTLTEGTINLGTVYTTFWWRPVTFPSSGEQAGVASFLDILGSFMGFLQVDSYQHLFWLDGLSSLVATGSTTLTAGTWYKIDIKSVTGSPGSFEVRINGNVEMSGSNDSNGGLNHGKLALGTWDSPLAAGIESWYDDVVLDSTNYYVGNPTVLRIDPTGDGNSAQWAAGTAPSDYTTVDEIPANATDYIQCGTGGNQRHLVTLQDCATVGIIKDPDAVKAWVKVRENTTVTSNLKITFRSNGTNYDSSGINTTTALVSKHAIRTTDPGTGAAWTIAGVNALEIGVLEVNNVAQRCSAIHALVLFNNINLCAVPSLGVATSLKIPASTVSDNSRSSVPVATLNTSTLTPLTTVSSTTVIHGSNRYGHARRGSRGHFIRIR